MADDNKNKPKIAQVEGGKSINTLIDETNLVYKRFADEIKGPLDAKRTEVLNICGFKKVKGANIKTCYLGAMLAMIAAAPQISVESVQKQVQVLTEPPYIKVKVVDDWEPTFSGLESWIQLYIDKAQTATGLIGEAETLLPKAKDVVANASSEYSDLDLMAKAKMAKANLNASNEIKKALTEIVNDCKAIADELNTLKGTVESM